jgi:hypothetical protein
MGIATENIGAGVNGIVMSFGTLTGLDTRGTAASALAVGDEDWDDGTILYAHPTVPGKLTEVRPQHDLAIAFTTVRHGSTGQIAIRIVPGNFHLEWLHDVSADNPSDGDIIQYKTSSSLWTKDSISGAGIAASTHTHAYQPAGTYVTAVNGTAPISASTSTAGVVTVGLSASYASSVHTHATSDVTSGNFVATLAAGTGVTVTGADANAAAKTVAIGQAVATSDSPTFAGLTVNGAITASFVPIRMATGTYAMSSSAAATGNTSVTFPVNRFTQVPNIVVGLTGAPGGSQKAVARIAGSPTTAGFTGYWYSGDQTNITFTSATFSYIATQATSASANG